MRLPGSPAASISVLLQGLLHPCVAVALDSLAPELRGPCLLCKGASKLAAGVVFTARCLTMDSCSLPW